MTMSEIIYGLCALTAALCAWLLLKAYANRKNILLFWSGVFFLIQTLNNILLMLDKVVFQNIDISVVRHLIALTAIATLLYGLIMRTEVE
jgi:hypothetical protein